jgi:hypothetical protein
MDLTMIKCTCAPGYICLLCSGMVAVVVQVCSAIFALALGLFLFLRPTRAIDAQCRFYEKINWRLEPISMEKEIRNTKVMGLFLIVLVLISVLVLCAQAYADEDGGLIKGIENTLSGDEVNTGSGDETAGSSDAVYERNAMGEKVPEETDNSGDTQPIDEPL